MKKTKCDILSVLQAEQDWVSSSAMLEKAGVSRAAICKQVQRLRDAGYSIEASPRRGYRLVGRTDRPITGEVQPRLATRVIGRHYRFEEEMESTNLFLLRNMDSLPDGAVLVADSQSRGRGRFQREWFSPPGVSLHLSVLLKPDVAPAMAPTLALVAAASVLRAVHDTGCRDAVAKWPNDIMLGGRKLAGILCEMEAEADLIHGVVIGIGLNVNVDVFPPALKPIATSLRLGLGHPVSRPELLAAILNHLEADYEDWKGRGLTGIVDFLNQHSYLAGEDVTVALTREKVAGRVEKITEAGTLLLIGPDGQEREIGSGEVQLCRPGSTSRQKGKA